MHQAAVLFCLPPRLRITLARKALMFSVNNCRSFGNTSAIPEVSKILEHFSSCTSPSS